MLSPPHISGLRFSIPFMPRETALIGRVGALVPPSRVGCNNVVLHDAPQPATTPRR
jgi:hypothetical protein